MECPQLSRYQPNLGAIEVTLISDVGAHKLAELRHSLLPRIVTVSSEDLSRFSRRQGHSFSGRPVTFSYLEESHTSAWPGHKCSASLARSHNVGLDGHSFDLRNVTNKAIDLSQGLKRLVAPPLPIVQNV